MYLAPWQVFLGGCVIGTLISFIVLTVLIINTIGKFGIKGVRFQDISEISGDDKEEEELRTDSKNEVDLLAKLSFILLNRNCITQDDVDFMMENITFEEWKHLIEKEINTAKGHNKDENN